MLTVEGSRIGVPCEWLPPGQACQPEPAAHTGLAGLHAAHGQGSRGELGAGLSLISPKPSVNGQ